jgi:hypothetical protein
MDTLTLAADRAHCVRPTGRAMCAEIQGQRPIRDGFSTGDVALQAGSRGLLRGGWRMARFDWTGRSALRDELGGHQRASGGHRMLLWAASHHTHTVAFMSKLGTRRVSHRL